MTTTTNQISGNTPLKLTIGYSTGEAALKTGQPNRKLQDAADKVTNVGITITNLSTSSANTDFMLHMMKMPQELKIKVVEGLSDRELIAFEIAIAKGSTIDPKFTSAFKWLQHIMIEIRQRRIRRILTNILANHPTWQSQVDAWKNVSVENTIWLLRLYELDQFFAQLYPPFRLLYQIEALQRGFEPSDRTPELLRPNTKSEIEKKLSSIEEICKEEICIEKCPDAICLLVNLRELRLVITNPMTPDLSRNVNLKRLNLQYSKLIMAPDLRQNVKLEELNLADNQLIMPPDLSQNIHLKELWLNNNKLTTAPDVSRNVNLQLLILDHNQLTIAPELSRNIYLTELSFDNNQLTKPPNVSQNVNLAHFSIDNNPLTKEAEKQVDALKEALWNPNTKNNSSTTNE